MVKSIVAVATMALSFVFIGAEVKALPGSCSSRIFTNASPDTGHASCLTWQPGDRAEAVLVCRNWAGQTTTSGPNANDIWGPYQTSIDQCPSSYPTAQSLIIRKWNIA